MRYAVIQTGGKQYKVKEGDVLEVEKLAAEPNEEVIFDQVLLYADNGNVRIGTPILSDVIVKAKVISHIKSKKLKVMKYKAKVRYRRVMGNRQSLTQVKIDNIQEKDTFEKKQKNSKK